jgi:dTDP-4-dehydrorhamnose 3,5-epimerase
MTFAGAFIVRGSRYTDHRGDFRVHLDPASHDSLTAEHAPTQVASAHNDVRGTIRGMHYQVSPHEQAKTLWCSAGAIFDVLVDLRREEPTYGQWLSVDLGGDAMAVHVPPGIAHGYQTLADDTVVSYVIRGHHDPASARTLLWNDPTVGVRWPLEVTAISDGDRIGIPWPAPR